MLGSFAFPDFKLQLLLGHNGRSSVTVTLVLPSAHAVSNVPPSDIGHCAGPLVDTESSVLPL